MSLPRQRALASLVAGFAFGCASPTAPIRIDATVRFTHSIEASCWTLVTANKVYEPLDLPSAFQVDDLAVHAVLSDAPDAISICSAGELVHVDNIATR